MTEQQYEFNGAHPSDYGRCLKFYLTRKATLRLQISLSSVLLEKGRAAAHKTKLQRAQMTINKL